MYLNALIRAFGQIREPASMKVLLGSIGAALGLAMVTAGATYWAISQVSEAAWVEALGGAAGFLIVLFLFPAIVVIVSSLFLETICRSVDARWYDGLPTAREQPLGESIQCAIMFGLKAIGLNLMILLLLIPPFTPLYPFVAAIVNAKLLSTEYFELVAVRRMDLKAAHAFRKQNSRKLWLAGFPIAGAIAVPILNLLVPIMATAYMSHIFHALNPPIATGDALEADSTTPPELP